MDPGNGAGGAGGDNSAGTGIQCHERGALRHVPGGDHSAIALVVIVSMAASGLASVLPWIRTLSSGTRIIVLTILIAGAAAWLRPVEEKEEREVKAE